MKSWSEHLEPVRICDLSDGGSIYQFVCIGKGCLSSMIISNGEAAIVSEEKWTQPTGYLQRMQRKLCSIMLCLKRARP
ncbi:hypothetical protein PBAT_11895 [Paenibacillus antarcticus]|uniref:Uncharacterized protein n=1 Tax=Paenibacillus antarcticus TaxID=253703 RepID=A0A168NBE1_9BACL|nr:hypothetical protein PBAT_11895 [Paenibacillus antarcticus]